jgi:hypothetical protein
MSISPATSDSKHTVAATESLTPFPPDEGDFLLWMTVAPLKKIE